MRAVFKGFKDCERTKNSDYKATDNYGVRIGSEYYVLGVTGWKEAEYLLVIDEDGFISSPPAVFFEITDNRVPNDWILTILNGEYGFNFILGAEILAKDDKAYNDLFEGDAESTEAIWSYIDSLGDQVNPIIPD